MNGVQDAGARRSVLYVEDHPVNAMLMGALFERRPGLKLVLAENGLHAMTIAPGLHPALLLLDLRLPDCHGAQLLPLLRQLPGCEEAPAVAVTAEDDFDIAGTGFVELWAKPLDLDHVLRRIDALVDTEQPADAGLMAGARPVAASLQRSATMPSSLPSGGMATRRVPSWPQAVTAWR